MRTTRSYVGFSLMLGLIGLAASHCIVVTHPAPTPTAGPSVTPPVPTSVAAVPEPTPAVSSAAPPAATSATPPKKHGRLRIPGRLPGTIGSRGSGWINCPGGKCGTPGKVQCGPAQCASAAQACCIPPDSTAPRCVAKHQLLNEGTCCPSPTGLAGLCHTGSVPMACDDSTDCAAGMSCCLRFGDDGSVSSACGIGPCADGELCSDKGGCSTGTRCAANPGAPGGTCRKADQKMPCGNLTCSGDRPYCKWDGARGAGTCAGPDPSGRSINGLFECMSSAECIQGESCCVTAAPDQAYSFCSSSCPAGGTSQPGCTDLASCPKDQGTALSCEPSKDARLPQGQKLCVYGQ